MNLHFQLILSKVIILVWISQPLLGVYVNTNEVHTFLDIGIDVESGFILVKEPKNINYLPVRPYESYFIVNKTIYILDDIGYLIDFAKKNNFVKLDLKIL